MLVETIVPPPCPAVPLGTECDCINVICLTSTYHTTFRPYGTVEHGTISISTNILSLTGQKKNELFLYYKQILYTPAQTVCQVSMRQETLPEPETENY